MQEKPDELRQLEDQLRTAETSTTTPDYSSVMHALEQLSKAYRKHDRLLDAANAEARLRLLTGKHVHAAASRDAITGKMLSQRRWGFKDLEFFIVAFASGLLVLLLWFVVTISLGRLLPNVRWVTVVIALCFYLAPTILVLVSKTSSGTVRERWKLLAMIAAINTFVGWTVVGWLLAFVCAMIEARNIRLPLSESLDYMDCPKCGESIKRKAVLCRYCQSDLPGQQTDIK